MTDALPAKAVDAPDTSALEAIFAREFSYVFHSLRRLGVAERDLEDLTHDVFVTFHRRRDDYDPERPVRPWLFGIAYRLASAARSRSGAQREVLGEPDGARDATDDAPTAEELLDEERRRRLVIAGLDALDAPKKAILILHDLDGVAMADAAATLRIPVNTAYSRLRAAREDFRRAVQRLRARGAR